MLDQVRDFWRHEEIEDDDGRYLKRVLYVILIGATTISAAIAILGLIVDWPVTARYMGATALLCAVLLWQVRRGRPLIARLAIPLLAVVGAFFMAARSGGLFDEAMLGYPLAIVLAGLLMGRRGIVLYVPLSGLAATVVGVAQMNGQVATDHLYEASAGNLVIIWLLLGLTGMMSYLSDSALTRGLRRARGNERALAESNLALQAVQQSLEDQVAERTRHAEQALREAETARKALLAEMWQTAGLAQLGNTLRGEQDCPTLARKVLSQMCAYLDGQVGTLFLADVARGQTATLSLAAGYAYAPAAGASPHISLGEGLVGQAVLEKRPVVLSIPDGSLVLASGLGQHPPRHILIVPLVYEDQVVGALEMGSLGEFTPAHLEFAGRAAENIAIAVHTAQTRTRVNQLLAETQQQAEELQAQEEELRAINEQLQAQADRLLKRGEASA